LPKRAPSLIINYYTEIVKVIKISMCHTWSLLLSIVELLMLSDVAASDAVEMPDGLGHAVGEERWELLARLAGNDVRMHVILTN